MTSRTTLKLCFAATACLSLGSIALAGPTTAPANTLDVKSDPYLLSTCPISGGKLGSMGDPIVKTIDGREVRFCCGGCVGRFEGNTTKYFAVMDKAIIAQQMPFYPVKTCVVSGESLVIKGKDIGVNHVYKNRLVRLCCKGCIREFNAEPAGFLRNLDAAVVKAQNADYPLKDCIVLEGSTLGSMGKPVEIVVANRLVKFCCKGCQPKFDKDPAAYIVRLDKAWKPIHQGKDD
jgi:YHS domain-containing protein